MGIYLSKDGNLTSSQKEWADAKKIPHDKYKNILLQRLKEMENIPESRRKPLELDVIEAKNPVLVVGHGPSFRKHFEKYNSMGIPMVVVEVSANELLKNGIIPDYVITLESSKSSVNRNMFDFDMFKENKDQITVVGSTITRDDMMKYFRDEIGMKYEYFTFDEEPRCSNCGLFAINYAKRKLKADKIILIGFEHEGKEYSDLTYRLWKTDFMYFIKKWEKGTIINCSESDMLYYRDYVIKSNMEKLNCLILE